MNQNHTLNRKGKLQALCMLIAWGALAVAVWAQAPQPGNPVTVDSNSRVNRSLKVPTGKTLELESGSTLNTGGTLTLWGSSSTSASTFRSAMGLAIGSNVQAFDADLSLWAGVTPSASMLDLADESSFSAMRTKLGLAIGTDVQAYSANLASWAGVTPSAPMLDLANEATFPALQSKLGLDGSCYISANFHSSDASGTSDTRLYIRTSTDGVNWHVLNGGQPVYTVEGYVGNTDKVVRDPAITYIASTGKFYVAHTSGPIGFTNYFSVLESSDLLNWTKIKDVSTASIATGGVGNCLTWDPCIFQDTNGTIRVYIAIQATGTDLSGLKLYTTYPTTSDWSGTWASLTLVDMPAADDKVYNDCVVWRGADSYLYMIAADYNSGSPYKVYTAGATNNYNGPWTLIRNLGQDTNEGAAVIPRADGSVWFYLEGLGYAVGHPGYRRWLLTPGANGTGLDYADGASNYTTIRDDVDSGRYYNGQIIKYTGPLAASLAAACDDRQNSMAEQHSGNVAITGGSISNVSVSSARQTELAAGYSLLIPSHGGWTGGGIKFKNAAGTVVGIMGAGSDSNYYWDIPTGGLINIFDSGHAGPLFTFNNSGQFTASSVVSSGVVTGTNITASGALRATGGGVKVIPHGAYTGGGLICMAQNGTDEAMVFGVGSDNNGYWNLPTGGGGMTIVASDKSTQVFKLANDGTFTANKLQIVSPGVPASASATGVAGTIAWDANYIYICTATNTWKRVAISTW